MIDFNLVKWVFTGITVIYAVYFFYNWINSLYYRSKKGSKRSSFILVIVLIFFVLILNLIQWMFLE